MKRILTLLAAVGMIAACAGPAALTPPPTSTTTTTTVPVVAPAHETTLACPAGESAFGCGGHIVCAPAGTTCCGGALCYPGNVCNCR